ncbi:hypothetical protein SAMN05216269_10139 [Flavobacterium xinjiangense]|uniref:Uncharacterized protein n=1 Tax=Flavobacterium xinjiangense TaxID=178356 RepID=A0A1M7D905_9FLAO|nr:hypothetical protein SAMN05216269_10139 [Flavobacterium xinjiangense]
MTLDSKLLRSVTKIKRKHFLIYVFILWFKTKKPALSAGLNN